jgi:hypothetical protein
VAIPEPRLEATYFKEGVRIWDYGKLRHRDFLPLVPRPSSRRNCLRVIVLALWVVFIALQPKALPLARSDGNWVNGTKVKSFAQSVSPRVSEYSATRVRRTQEVLFSRTSRSRL